MAAGGPGGGDAAVEALAGLVIKINAYLGTKGLSKLIIAKATWNWVRGKCQEAMREVLGAG